MKDNVLFISVWAAYASLRPHIIKEGSSAESVLESRATWGLCYLSLLNKTGKNSRTDLVEVWKTPIGYLQVPGRPLPIPTSEWRFPHLEDAFFRVFGRNCGGDLRKKRFSKFCLKVQ